MLLADERNVSLKYEDSAEITKATTATVGEREYLIAPPKANALLTEIGIMGQNGKIKNDMVRKYNQIDHFVSLASDYLKRIEGGAEVLDCACGKSYLSFAAYHYFANVRKMKVSMSGVDLKPDVVEHCNKTAKTLGFDGLEFVCGDINDPSFRAPMLWISLQQPKNRGS